MSLNTTPKSDSGSASLPTRLISALLGGGFAFMAASYFTAGLLPIIAAVLVAVIGLVAPKWLLLPVAGVVVPTYKLGKYLSKEAYRGFMRGILNFFIGVPSAIGAAVATATYVGWAHNLSLLIWFPACCIAFLVTFFILEPAAYLYILKPTGDGLEKLWNKTRDLAKAYAKPFFQGLVNIVRNLPGSNGLWTWVENKEKGAQWVDGFVGVVTGLGVLGLTCGTAYTVFNFVEPYAALVATGWLMTGITGFAAGVAAIAVVGVLFQLLDKGELPFAATALTGAGVYALLPVSAAFGFGLPATIGVGALEFVLGLAYVYPAVHGILKSGLIKTILEGVRKLVEKTYDEKDADYRKFFAGIVTPVIALISGGLAFWALAFYGLPLVVILPVAALCALITYLGTGEAFDDLPTTIGVGVVLSLATGFGLWYFFADAFSAWVFWPAAVLAVAFTFTVLLTSIYLGFRAITFPVAKPIGGALDSAHKSAYKAARDLTKWWDNKVIDKTYTEYKSDDYSKGVLHVFNLAVLALGVWQALPLVNGWHGLPTWLITTGLCVSAGLVYLLVGRILLSAGTIAIGFAVGLGTFASGTWALYQIAPDQWWLAAVVSAAATSAIFYVVTPAVLLVIRTLLGWLIEPVGKYALTPVYDFAWARFEFVWDAFLVVAKFVNTWLIMPIVRVFAAFAKAIADAWNSLTGRK